MNSSDISNPQTSDDEQSLDPQDWDELRRLGHRMVEDMMDYLQTVRERPAWKKTPEAILQELRQPLPRGPQDAAAVYEDFTRQVLPYNCNNIHPRFWGWVQGGGTPFGMLADMLAIIRLAQLPILSVLDHLGSKPNSPVFFFCCG